MLVKILCVFSNNKDKIITGISKKYSDYFLFDRTEI